MDDFENQATRALPTTSEIQLSDNQRRVAKQYDLSSVMVDSLGRVKAGGHTYPTRIRALVRRDLVTGDQKRLTAEGVRVADALGI